MGNGSTLTPAGIMRALKDADKVRYVLGMDFLIPGEVIDRGGLKYLILGEDTTAPGLFKALSIGTDAGQLTGTEPVIGTLVTVYDPRILNLWKRKAEIEASPYRYKEGIVERLTKVAEEMGLSEADLENILE